MATQPLPEEDLSCPVCCDIFKDPVVLSCSHSFCEDCLKKYWVNNHHRPCPVCRNLSLTDTPPVNLALRNLCAAFKEDTERRTAAQSKLCGRHGDQLKLFCLEDKRPVCVDCLTREHKDHKFCSSQEAVQMYKVDPMSCHPMLAIASNLGFYLSRVMRYVATTRKDIVCYVYDISNQQLVLVFRTLIF